MKVRQVAGHALLVEFGTEITAEAHDRVLALDRALAAHPPEGLIEAVPAFVNIALTFDPARTTAAKLERALSLLPQSAGRATPATHVVPMRYDGRDLAEVARRTGLTEADVAETHAAAEFEVYLYGFAPGYAYLGGLPPALRLDRKPQPLRDVPAGSVIIAGSQCLITTLTMPTGWWIIGHSPARILTGDPDRPFLFEVGDRIRFEARP